MAALAPLFSKQIKDLTLDDLNVVKETLDVKVEVTEELKNAATQLLLGMNIGKVSDLIQSPESIKQLMGFFATQKVSAAEALIIVQCPHCTNFFLSE